MYEISAWGPWLLVLLSILLFWWAILPFRKMLRDPEILPVQAVVLPIPMFLALASLATAFWLFESVWRTAFFLTLLVALAYLIHLVIARFRAIKDARRNSHRF